MQLTKEVKEDAVSVVLAQLMIVSFWIGGILLCCVEIFAYSEIPIYGKIFLYEADMYTCYYYIISYYLSPFLAVVVFYSSSRLVYNVSVTRNFVITAVTVTAITSVGFPLYASLPLFVGLQPDRDLVSFFSRASSLLGMLNTIIALPLCSILFSVQAKGSKRST